MAEAPERLVERVTKRILEVCRSKGLTQADLAEMIGTATKNYQRIERGQNLTLWTLARIANALDVEVEVFFTRTEKPRR